MDKYLNKIICGDCLEILKELPDNSVDLVLTDPPYGTTACKWDSVIPFEPMWERLNKLIKPNGAIVLFGSEPFSSALRMSNIKKYKYDWIWEKDNGTNAPNTPYQPFRIHEFVLVFGKGRVTNGKRIPMKYNPQKTKGEPYKQMSGKVSENWKGGLKKCGYR